MKALLVRHRIPLSIALVLSILSPTSGRAQEAMPDCWVLSAGVDNYPHANRLQGCVNDARNTAAAFQAQQGKKFGKVHAQTLVNAEATRDRILRKLAQFTQVGKPGDFVVLFLSGHGERGWRFLPHDFDPRNHANTVLTDRQILAAADVLMSKGKKVVVIVDACFAGQLQDTARAHLAKYRDRQGGGLILMLSSSANQTSAALGPYSAFAKAFADSLGGNADLDGDGKITLAEIRSYSHRRTLELLRQRGMAARQDAELAWSPSIHENMSLATLRPAGIRLAENPPAIKPIRSASSSPVLLAKGSFKEWIGTEDLSGYGALTFRLYDKGKAVMIDTAGASEGTWKQTGTQITLRFHNGRVVYTGSLNGANLSGSARNQRTSWTWNAQDAALASAAADGLGGP